MAEIRCQIVKEGDYQDTKFFIRMFQPDGVGELRLDDGRVLLPNDLYPLKKKRSGCITLRIVPTSR